MPYLSYEQMYTLAQAGATVLHPDAVKPLQTKGIPLVVGNFYNKHAPQTLVSNVPNRQKLLCVTQKQEGDNFVATVVHNMSAKQVFCNLSSIDKPLDFVQCAPNCVTISTKTNILQHIFDVFSGNSQSN